MEYDRLDLRFPWRFFQGKNIITADSILYGTRNLERKHCKGLQQRKSFLTKRQRKDFEPMNKVKKKNLASPKIKHANISISLSVGKN